MKRTLVICFMANLLLAAVTFFITPPTVAIHFGFGGRPDGWAPSYVNALIMSGVNTLIFLSFHLTPRLIRSTPANYMNIPNKDYWLREENRGRVEAILMPWLYRFGTVTMLLMLAVGLLTLQANLSDPVNLREDIFMWMLGLYLAYTLYWTVMMAAAFRVPKGE